MFRKILHYFKNPFVRPSKGVISFKNKWLNFTFRLMGWIDLALLPLYAYLALEFIHYASTTQFTNFMTTRTPAVKFSLMIMYGILGLLLLFFRKGWLAGTVYSVSVIVIALCDYYKFALTGDYLYPWDIWSQSGNVGELASFLSTPLPYWVWVLIAGFAVACTALILTKPEVPVKAYVRFPAALAAVLCIINGVSTPEKVQTVLHSHSLYLEDMALQTSNYTANGFVGAFTVNALSTNVTEPEGYGADMMEGIFGGYASTEADDSFINPDIILILSESFWDVRLLPGVEFSSNPLSNYDEIISRENTVSGRFFTTAFGGGTVRPEFEVLTGLTADRFPSGSIPWQYVTSDTESYVSVYRSLGYKTVTMHPYTSSFYLRKEAYPKIGFDELIFDESFYNDPEITVEIDGKQIADSTFVKHIIRYADTSETPVFIFGISMENHQPYTNKYSEHSITVKSDSISEGVLADVENYTQGVYHADLALGQLVEWIDSRERDTVLVWFGDHLPTLGANYAAYDQSGMIDLDFVTPEMKESIQSTPYLIYSNFEMNDNAMVSKGTGNDLSSYNLMNAVATLIGAPRTSLSYFLEDYYDTYPYYNSRLFSEFPAGIRKYIDEHAAITYDRTVGKGYTLNK